MHFTIPQCPFAEKMLSSVIELDRPADLVVEMLSEVEQLLAVIQHRVGTQAPVSLPDQRITLSSLCVPCPNSLDPSMYIVPARPRVPALFEKVLYHFPS